MFSSHKTDKGRYILLPAFYARESALKLDEAALFIFVVILFTLGHVLVAVCYAVAGEDLTSVPVGRTSLHAEPPTLFEHITPKLHSLIRSS